MRAHQGKQRFLLSFLAMAVIAWQGWSARPAVAARTDASRGVEFNRHIRPILSDNCFACHGPDEKQRQEGLRLDTREGIFEDRYEYRIVVPGDPATSKLFSKITAAQDSQRMPPLKSGKKLTKEQIELIRQWIEQGAKWEEHWAFVPPRRAELPAVKNRNWPRNPIDHFILARLEQNGLKPSVEADRVTLMRRVTLDLTGLPPTPAEVDAFLADRSPEAYEKLVDRLLQSPHYGERMAMKWLDLARYADTHGYHIDSHRDMWLWRDWVIDAYNRNLPFDRFTIEQLAGDLLPDATLEQKIATGFNRNHMINFEGGAIPEEYQNEYLVDRVNTTATVWMGLTMTCARCHDHKYDPIRQQEFYRFYAFFNDIPEKGLDGRTGNAEPYVQVPDMAQKSGLQELSARIAGLEKALPEERVDSLLAEWERTAHLPPPSGSGLVAHYELDGHLSDTSGHYRHGEEGKGEVTYAEGKVKKAARFDGETWVTLGDTADFEGADSFSIALWINPGGRKKMPVLARVEESAGLRGYAIWMDEPEPLPYARKAAPLIVNLIHVWPDNAIEVRTKQPLLSGTWHHVALAYDGSGRAAGLHLFVNGKPQQVEVVKDSLTGSIRASGPLYLGKGTGEVLFEGSIDELRLYARRLPPEEAGQLAVDHPIQAILESHTRKRSEKQKQELRHYYLTHQAAPPWRKIYLELQDLQEERDALNKEIPTTMVMQHMEQPRDTFLLVRGDYRNRGDKVSPGVPSCLPPLPAEAPPNRLGVAQWLVDPSHPLTARVAVNRYWEMYFGNGIVNTLEDFGFQGDPPSHPELLDWLATEFVRSGWDIKAMQKLIVTSATYRQSSRVTPELLEKDPQNRLLARAPRLRLPAESVRDNALAMSGLLNTRIGGPSVFPYQPAGLWEQVSYGDRYSAQSYRQDQGKDLYRRSMYTFWKRTVPPPALATFDAPDRETCTVKRARTNTPLQALVLMNDPTYVEAARALAERMIRQGGSKPERRITYGFRLATARKPAPAELQVLLETLQAQLPGYRHDPGGAKKLLSVGESKPDESVDVVELAAWTTIASMLLNLDETITRE